MPAAQDVTNPQRRDRWVFCVAVRRNAQFHANIPAPAISHTCLEEKMRTFSDPSIYHGTARTAAIVCPRQDANLGSWHRETLPICHCRSHATISKISVRVSIPKLSAPYMAALKEAIQVCALQPVLNPISQGNASTFRLEEGR